MLPFDGIIPGLSAILETFDILKLPYSELNILLANAVYDLTGRMMTLTKSKKTNGMGPTREKSLKYRNDAMEIFNDHTPHFILWQLQKFSGRLRYTQEFLKPTRSFGTSCYRLQKDIPSELKNRRIYKLGNAKTILSYRFFFDILKFKKFLDEYELVPFFKISQHPPTFTL